MKSTVGVICLVLSILVIMFLLVVMSAGRDRQEPAVVHESVGVPAPAFTPAQPLPESFTNDHGQIIKWLWTDEVSKWLIDNKDKRLVSVAVETDSIYCIVYE